MHHSLAVALFFHWRFLYGASIGANNLAGFQGSHLSFADLHLSDALLKAVDDAGYTEPSAIQAAAIPSVLMGKDLIGVAQTGTGKTASFVLPMLDILGEGRTRARMPRSLIIEPTRELAAQVAENFEKYGRYHKLSMALLIGGVSFGDQDKALEKGVDVLIATPGRLLDQHERGKVLLSGVDILVIDEADRMLDMGFIPDVEKICSLLRPERQTLLFSATMPAPVKRLADTFMQSPKIVEVARPATTNENITQRLVSVGQMQKRQALRDLLHQAGDDVSAIVFCNRKTTVRELATSLKRHNFRAGQIHGDMDQPDRIRELDRFKAGEVNILVASDVAARGLDVKGVSHVFNFDVPWHPDDYVHRIGRTGRAGETGIAYTFATAADDEAVANIEKLTGQTIRRETIVLEDRPAGRSRQADSHHSDSRASQRPDARQAAGRGERQADGQPAGQTQEKRSRHGDDRHDGKSRDPRDRDQRDREQQGRGQRGERRRDQDQRDRGQGDRDQRNRGQRDRDQDLPPVIGFGTEDVPAFLMVSARR